MDHEAKLRELERLRQEVGRLEAELGPHAVSVDWPPRSYYTAYHIFAGFVLGMFGAASSLLFNIVGSLLIGEHPLHLIRVYLTFPLGAAALTTDDSLALAVGCCLYLGTGMVLGIPFHLVLSRWLAGASFAVRLAGVSILALAVWIVNYYAILSWLQPALFGGSWIVQDIPWWVGALTHLVFGWTMLFVQPLGAFIPYTIQREGP